MLYNEERVGAKLSTSACSIRRMPLECELGSHKIGLMLGNSWEDHAFEPWQ